MWQIIEGYNKKIIQKETQETLLIASVELRQIALVKTNVQQRLVTRKKYILDWLKESLKKVLWSVIK